MWTGGDGTVGPETLGISKFSASRTPLSTWSASPFLVTAPNMSSYLSAMKTLPENPLLYKMLYVILTSFLISGRCGFLKQCHVADLRLWHASLRFSATRVFKTVPHVFLYKNHWHTSFLNRWQTPVFKTVPVIFYHTVLHAWSKLQQTFDQKCNIQ
jgi:hypothetical protein